MRWERLLWWATAVFFFIVLVVMLQAVQYSQLPAVMMRFVLLVILAVIPAVLFALWEGWRHN